MTVANEVDVEFELLHVDHLDDATAQTVARLKELGVTDDRYTYSVSIRLYVDDEIRSADGVVIDLFWNADVKVKGRVK